MELLVAVIALTCSGIAWKIASGTDRMNPWEAAFGGLALGPIGLALVAIKCRSRA